MLLSSIDLKNFRLHKNTNLEFSNELNYIIGGNGQGKTTILEAIYYLCTTKNLNQSSDSEVVNFSENIFEVTGRFKDLTENKVRIYFDKEQNKKFYFTEEKQIYRASLIIGRFPVATLIQSDHAITKGSPSERRKFFDSVISQASSTYLNILLEYNKTLRQRSSLLSKIRETRDDSLYMQLEAWSETLIKNGTEIVKHRIQFIKEFNEYLAQSYQVIMKGSETPHVEYSFLGENDPKNVEDKFSDELNRLKDDELVRAQNLAGPHRDEFTFYVNNYELRRYGSQGQHKTFQIALKFGEFYYLKDKLGKTPIFLMDDIFGELDTYRAGQISDYTKNIGQAFVTLTDFSKLESIRKSTSDLLIKVENGSAEYA